MRLFYVLNIGERHTEFFGCFRVSNRVLCLLFGLAQFLVVVASLMQHVYSWAKFRHIFKCASNISEDATLEQRLLAYDVVIFDYGLMHRILKMSKCVANYLDGGYLRFSWCVQHSSALLLLIVIVAFGVKKLWLYWPALFMQSQYVLGMSIMTMATTPKMLEALSGHVDRPLGTAFCIYIGGVLLNWLFTLILWHHYWAVEADCPEGAQRQKGRDAWAEDEEELGGGGGRVSVRGQKKGTAVWKFG